MAFELQLLCLFFSMKLSKYVFINFNYDNLDSNMSPEDSNNSMHNETFQSHLKTFNIFPKMVGNANGTLESEDPQCFLKSESAG